MAKLAGFESYINDIIAKFFGDKEVNDPSIDITEKGWYWSDKNCNPRYTKWNGVYSSENEAIEAGREKKIKIIESF